MILHINVRKYTCRQCQGTSIRRDYFDRHIQNHFIQSPEGLKCTYLNCGKTFDTYSGLNSHHLLHTNIEPYESPLIQQGADSSQPLKCVWPDCPEVFHTLKRLKKHCRAMKILPLSQANKMNSDATFYPTKECMQTSKAKRQFHQGCQGCLSRSEAS